MQKIITILAAVLFTASTFSQSPHKMSYQAVIRDANNALVKNSSIGMRISILQASVSGAAVYVEMQTSITNINGLATMEIGNGTVISGNFANIDWSNGPYFIKTETDPTGGNNYHVAGTSELLSVPYALHAKTTESVSAETDPIYAASVAAGITGSDTASWNNKLDSFTETDPFFSTSVAAGITGSDTASWNNKQDALIAGAGIDITGNVVSSPGPFYLGLDTLGGIVYYIYIGGDGKQHGLIVSKTESTEQWQSLSSLVNANRTEDGAYNTALMVNSPAASYVTSLGSGWYLPSIGELGLLHRNRFIVNKTLRSSGFTLLGTERYWSSTEYDATVVFSFAFSNGEALDNNYKTLSWRVRAVRTF